MKLNDAFDFVVHLNEVFDTKIPVEQWKYVGNTLQGEFNFKDVQYVIQLQPGIINTNNHKYTIININFGIVDQHDNISRKLTYNNQSGSAVIGAIAHAILDKIPQYQYDAILFGATDNVKKRMAIYQGVLSYLKPGVYNPDFSTTNGRAALMFDDHVSKEQQNEILDFLRVK